jgi:hypothetical protein
VDEHTPASQASLTDPEATPGGVSSLTRQIAVGLLIWLGVNMGVFLGVSLLAFWAFRTLSIEQENAFVYSIICAVPTALLVSAYVAGRRVVKMLNEQR